VKQHVLSEVELLKAYLPVSSSQRKGVLLLQEKGPRSLELGEAEGRLEHVVDREFEIDLDLIERVLNRVH